jgi:biopolymer transport protein TolR
MLRRKPGRKPMSEINVVPYIDVMLVLLVIFMVTAPLLTQGVQVDLPKAASKPIDQAKDEPLIVSVKADGSFYLNLGENSGAAVELADIRTKVAAVIRRNPATPVLVWGDVKVPYGAVVTLMSELQSAGAPSVGLVTDAPPFEK